MKKFTRLSYVLWFLVIASCASQPKAATGPTPRTVLLISMDGYRWDYLDKAPNPNLKGLAKEGVRAKGLKSIFPSVTFPNHYTIVTGLYAEHHGIVANSMYDPKTQRLFEISNPREVDASDWWKGEPIWVTAQKQGLLSGTMFWVGSTAEIRGIRPTYWEKYDKKVTKSDRIEKVLSWLDSPPEKRPRFLTLYFEDADSVAHEFGPESKEEVKAIEGLDAAIGELLAGLKKRKLQDSIDIIVVSDHGMATVDPKHTITLADKIKVSNVEILGGGAFANLWTKSGDEEKVAEGLDLAKSHYQIYRKKDIPPRFHYRDHRRIAPILVVADEGWYLVKSGKRHHPNHSFGTHGYDNDLPSMQGTFIASGPSFRKGLETGTMENIDLYELMCHILGIKPAKNDGDFGRVRGLLRE